MKSKKSHNKENKSSKAEFKGGYRTEEKSARKEVKKKTA